MTTNKKRSQKAEGTGTSAGANAGEPEAVHDEGPVEPEGTAGSQESGDDPGAERASQEGCVVVGIGASAGGLEAYKQFLNELPSDTGLAFVLIQHLDPTHESLMVELLSRYTSMTVSQIESATPIEPNHVYMIPPNEFVTIKNGGLFLERPVTVRGVRLPIDHFFRSMAEAQKERAICVVLSGTGSDGAAGMREVKAEGGMTIAQDPGTSEYDGMPRAAIQTGCVDFVLPIQDMAEVIVPYARHPYVQARPDSSLAEASPDHFRAILSLLQAYTDHDFTRYKKGTLTRRIERRMGLRQISQPSAYLTLLREDSEELKSLFKDLLIGVTRFFRDDDAWQQLRRTVDEVISAKADDDPFRVWVPGCATGEEAYSVAMLLNDAQTRLGRRLDVQIFGTDIDADAIHTARMGVYRDNLTKDLPENYFDRYFQREADAWQVRKKLRLLCVFAVQNVLSDPPFSGLDLICCRNLLIYIEPNAQGRVFDMFHFALRPSGLLFLGTSESPSKRRDLFDVISQPARIYRKRGESRPTKSGFPFAGHSSARQQVAPATAELATAGVTATVELSKRALLQEFAPASVVVDDRGTIQYMHGKVRDYLDFPSGEPQLDVSAMSFEGLRAKVRAALEEARSSGKPVSAKVPRMRRNGGHVAVDLRVLPLPGNSDSARFFLLSFVDDSEPVERVEGIDLTDSAELETEVGGKATENEHRLALELRSVREDLQSTIEELESANEELKASNEEVMSMNEELQSTNEELETSREELQSLNEELSTVNNQLHDKVEELEATTNDLSNLLSSTDMATLFLDPDLRIRRFTPATVRLMSLLDTDIGRPLSDLSPRVDDPTLVEDAKEVLAHLTAVESEVRNGGGHSYIRRITPFRTTENKIEGVVITFSDVTRLKDASERVEFREQQQASVARLGRLALGGADVESLLEHATRELTETIGVEYSKVLRLSTDKKSFRLVSGVGWEAGAEELPVPAGLESQAGFTLQSASPVIVENLKKDKRFSGPQLLRDHDVKSGISVVIGPTDSPWGILGVHSDRVMDFTVDDTNFLQAIANLLWEAIEGDWNKQRFQALVATSASVYWTTDARGVVVEDSPTWREFTGQTLDEWLGWGWLDAIHPDDQKQTKSAWTSAVESVESLKVDYRLRRRDGSWRWMEVNATPLLDFEGRVREWVGMNTDITREKEASARQAYLAAIIDGSNDAIIGETLEGEVTSWNRAAERLYGYSSEEMIGQTIERIVPPDQPEELSRILDSVHGGETIQHYRTRRLAKDGTLRNVSLTISPVTDGDGAVVGSSVIARDISQELHLEQELKKSRRAAESASEAKSAFLANMSHEIRTPLTAILGYAEVLSANLDDDDARACALTIRDNGRHLLGVLNDILDLSRIESGKMEATLEPQSIVDVLSDVVSLMSVRATEKSLLLNLSFDGPMPRSIETDARFVRQVLVNLIGNAIKFTRQGKIDVGVRVLRDEEILEMSVEDTGRGISEEQMESLFVSFEQGDPSLARAAGGSGLGLAITKELVELLEGTVTVESTVDVGSTFTVRLPTGSLEGIAFDDVGSDVLRPGLRSAPTDEVIEIDGHVLVVDDRREVRFLLRQMLRAAGATVTTVADGQSALERCSAPDGGGFDLVLLDLQMPDMDGKEVVSRLRADGFSKPIIAITAHAMPSHREAGLAAGFDDFLTKPIDRMGLLTSVRRWTQKGSHDSPLEALEVLFIDDCEDTGALMKRHIEASGHAVSVASSGEEAMERLSEAVPDVVLMDLHLPDVSGVELVKQLKLDARLKNVVMVCISGWPRERVDWRAAGFEHYLLKPVELAVLDELLQSIAATKLEE